MKKSVREQEQVHPPEVRTFARPAKDPPAADATAGPVLRLQRTIGNRRVQRLLEPGAPALGPVPVPLRRLQPKLMVNAPGDRFEREADRAADEVLRAPGPPLAGLAAPPDRLSRTADDPAGAAAAAEAPPAVHAVLGSPGQPLDAGTRAFMEPRFGHDFGRVRTHTDALAARSAEEIGAHAYTAGRHVVFGAQRFSPGTDAGRRLLAHELAHVVQQDGAGPAAQGRVQRKESYPLLHQQILQALIAITRKHPKDGAERLPALRALATTVPAADQALLRERLTRPGSTDAFAVFLKEQFPATRGAFLEAIGVPAAPAPAADAPAADAPGAAAPTIVPQAAAPPAHVQSELVSERFADVGSLPLYLDNFTNDINDAWLPNDRVFVFAYPNGSVLRIAYQDLVRALDVKSDLNPKLTLEEAKKKYRIPDDLVLPSVPGQGEPQVTTMTMEKIVFHRDQESGIVFPAGTRIPRSYLPRIAAAIGQIEPTRADEELVTQSLPKILEAITGMQWSAPRGLGPLLVRLGRRLRGKGAFNLAKDAQKLVREIRAQKKPVVVNIGGTGAPHEPPHAINLNPNQVAPRNDIPNLLEAPGEELAGLFKAGQVDAIEAFNLAPGVLDWKKIAPGAFKTLKSGGTVTIRFRGASGTGETERLAEALEKAGFPKDRITNYSGAVVEATKP